MLHREVDIGLVLALLLGVANGDTFERIDAVHAVLAWRSRKGQVTEGAIALYIASLKVRWSLSPCQAGCHACDEPCQCQSCRFTNNMRAYVRVKHCAA